MVSLILIRWIVIYLVDSAVQRFNKRGQIDIFCKFYSNIYSIPSLRTLPHQFGMKNHCFPYLLLAKTNQDFCLYTCLLWHSWTCVQSVRLFRLCPKAEKILKGRRTVLRGSLPKSVPLDFGLAKTFASYFYHQHYYLS